jgi:hypothetical protein
MSLADGLNLFWALGAVAAIGLLAFRERRRVSRLRDRCRRGFVVFLAAVALFPCISASDDLVRFGVMPAALRGQGTKVEAAVPASSGSSHAVHLARLLEALESFQIAVAIKALVALCFFTWVLFAAEFASERIALSSTSRAPPSLSCFSS